MRRGVNHPVYALLADRIPFLLPAVVGRVYKNFQISFSVPACRQAGWATGRGLTTSFGSKLTDQNFINDYIQIISIFFLLKIMISMYADNIRIKNVQQIRILHNLVLSRSYDSQISFQR
jgi:hypothetical protein